MKLKHFFIFLLTSLLLASCSDDKNETLPEDIVAQGTDGDNIKWILQRSGTLTIDGNGQMKDHTRSADNGKSSAPWANYLSNDVKKIVISNSITSIGASAFAGCSALQSLTIPESVTSIGASAFAGCSALAEFTVPESVTSIGDNAFDKEDELKNIQAQGTDGENIKWVLQEGGTLTIYGSGKMKDHEDFRTVPWGRYQNPFVNKIIISDSITHIGAYTLGSSHIKSLTIPESVTSIGDYAFKDSYSLMALTIPETVTSIGEGAFVNCVNITELVIPKSITSIERGTFGNFYGLEKLTISESVTRIRDYGFGGCYSLKEIIIPNSVTEIGPGAFTDCNKATKIVIPKSVTTIGQDAFVSMFTFKDDETNALQTIYSYCPVSAYPTDKLVFTESDERILSATIYVSTSDLKDYKAAQATYWDKMSITISDTPAP